MKIMELTEENFERDVIQSDVPVLVDFYATWCGPCKMMVPVLEELSREHETCHIGKIDIDQYPDLAQEFQVMSVPTFFLFENGKPQKRMSGMMKKKDLEAWINRMETGK